MARNDTNVGDDTQLAILASLLEPASYPVLELSEALRDNKGDVAAAAEALLLPRVKSSGKRKAGTSLESWLGKKRGSEAVKQQVEVDLTESSPSRRSLPATTSSTPPKPLKNAFTLLTSTSTSSASPAPKSKAPARPAIPLATQSAIDAHSLPLTLLKSPLSPALASALFLALMQESEEWERHRWFLAGRWVESPHTSANFYRRRGGYGQSGMREDGLHMEDEEEHLAPRVEEEKGIALESEKKRAGSSSVAPPDAKTGGSKVAEGRYYYSGSELFPPKPYPNLLHRAAELIEPVVNASLRAHSRHPLEYAGEWRANVCGANRYDGAAIGVGWHADQLTYLGPAATICSLSLGTTRAFRVRQTEAVSTSELSTSGETTKPIRTYELTLAHNSLVLMDAGCQERFKHTIPPQKAIDLFRPTYNMDMEPIPLYAQEPHTARINITFRFYRRDFHPSPGDSWRGKVDVAGVEGMERMGTPYCKCGIPTLLRADQKAKARANLALPTRAEPLTSTQVKADASLGSDRAIARNWLRIHEPEYDFPRALAESRVRSDDMVYFWQCQSPGNTGELKGCGFFKVLDMRKEGRGPCWGDVVRPGA